MEVESRQVSPLFAIVYGLSALFDCSVETHIHGHPVYLCVRSMFKENLREHVLMISTGTIETMPIKIFINPPAVEVEKINNLNPLIARMRA